MFYGIRTHLGQEFWNNWLTETKLFVSSTQPSFLPSYIDNQPKEVKDNTLNKLEQARSAFVDIWPVDPQGEILRGLGQSRL